MCMCSISKTQKLDFKDEEKQKISTVLAKLGSKKNLLLPFFEVF